MYQLYLNLGGWEEIRKMNYWDFTNIINTLNQNNTRGSGKPVIHKKVPESSKDMINRTKNIGK